MAPVLGYWNIRARAESIRYLLHYTNTEFVEKRYEMGLDFKSGEWFSQDKFNLDLDLPNLPYWIDGDLKLTQSLAIMKHLARKHGLVDDGTEKKRAVMEMFEQHCQDVYWKLRTVANSITFDADYQEYVRDLPEQLKPISMYMKNKPWILGEKLTYVDFLLFVVLDRMRELVPDCLRTFANLKDYVERFENLPKIAEYRRSEEHPKLSWPVFSSASKFMQSRDQSSAK